MCDNINAVAFLITAETLLEVATTLSENDEDTSTDDENILKAPKETLFTPTRIEYYVERVAPGLNAQQFQQHFRVTINVYEHLLHIIAPQLQQQSHVGRVAINAEKYILSVIWVMATQDSYRYSYRYHISFIFSHFKLSAVTYFAKGIPFEI
ncbi:hypothetical protein QE152_g25560 [Popillia japonica]|uniref:Uncharacterized protein n=1 Tax=Popillia japonica TaxID=7064 RepID=A0AAW1K168_POPJA